MTAILPAHFSCHDGDDVILQDGRGRTARFTPEALVDRYSHARDVDGETATHDGIRWHRDHLAGAVNLAMDAGLIDRCAHDTGEPHPVTEPNETRCPAHRRTA